uniref:NADH-ubiquinone oxidoreductase chain 1 n=1 Tax=Phyxioschema suthepium TaxID=1155482 RepID=L7NWN6_9ARAC|nr:NADH dehydrogenase subunit 1 [Phyxioschema suthepium]AFC77868.1 NADH dehydrogenase subunit 1 [Phyxioschema suthepium]
MIILSSLLIFVSSLLSVAFYTILERKFLSYIQLRKGPNKVGLMGILQPFSDAVKLFSKAISFPETSNFSLSFLSPLLSLILSVLIFMIIPFAFSGILDLNLSILSFFIISSINVYIIILIGWSSNSKYSFLGSIRSVAQMISYEVSLFLIILSASILSSSFSLSNFWLFQSIFPFFLFLLIPSSIWMISCVAETNRSPFDFAEGESELVSGFNIDYMGGLFAMIFLSEYLSMISLSFISVIIFISHLQSISSLMIISLSILFLWIRGTFPRFRYDLLMSLNWKIFLPTSISFFLIPFSISI